MNLNDIMYGVDVPNLPIRTKAFLIIAFVATGLSLILLPFAFFSNLGVQATIVFATVAACYYAAALLVKLTKSNEAPES